jgi:hypothetical protein
VEAKRRDDGEQQSIAELELIFLQLINFARFARLGPSEDALRRYIEAATRIDIDIDMSEPIATADPTLWMRVRKRNEIFLQIARAFQVFRASLPTFEATAEADRAAEMVLVLEGMAR